jgi:hypothetical protein
MRHGSAFATICRNRSPKLSRQWRIGSRLR